MNLIIPKGEVRDQGVRDEARRAFETFWEAITAFRKYNDSSPLGNLVRETHQLRKNVTYLTVDLSKVEGELWPVAIKLNIDRYGSKKIHSGYFIPKNGENSIIMVNRPGWNKGTIESTFIHEFIHFLDFKRSVPMYGTSYLDGSDYYCHPVEYNAIYQTAVYELLQELRTMKRSRAERYIRETRDFSCFTLSVDSFSSFVISCCTEKYRRKWKKRIYRLWKVVQDDPGHYLPVLRKKPKCPRSYALSLKA